MSSGFENRILMVAIVVVMLRIRMRAESHSEEVSAFSVQSKCSVGMSQPRASPSESIYSERCSQGRKAGRSEKRLPEGQVENPESVMFHGWGGVGGGPKG